MTVPVSAIQHDAWRVNIYLLAWLVWRDLMGYEDGNELINLYEWGMKWCCYLANVAVCKCLSKRVTLILYIAHCHHCLCSVNLMKRFEWCFSFDFLLLTFISFLSWFDLTWLLCIIYSILSKLSMYLIEFTSKLYFTSTWAPLSSIENKDTYYHYHTGMESNIQLKVQERTEKVASGYDQRAVDISRAVRR